MCVLRYDVYGDPFDLKYRLVRNFKRNVPVHDDHRTRNSIGCLSSQLCNGMNSLQLAAVVCVESTNGAAEMSALKALARRLCAGLACVYMHCLARQIERSDRRSDDRTVKLL